MDALKSKKRFIQENAFKQKREEPRLKFNPGLTLIGLRTTGPWSINELLRGQEENFYLWDQHGKFPSGQNGPISPAWVANKNAGFALSCPLEVAVGHFLSLAWK